MVVGARGWQTHSVTPGERLTKLDRHGAPLSAYLGVLGMPGATAFRGVTEICQPKKGETVVISAASGAVGSVAGQLAKRAGARVVGVAGGAEKCLWVQDSLGFDDCVDHRALDLRAELAAACPNGIDAYFENVGGAVQAAVFDLLNPFARVAMCGMVSQYNEAEFPPGPNLGFVVGKRVTIQGFIVSDKPEKLAEWRKLCGALGSRRQPDLPRGRGGSAGERPRRVGRHAGRPQFRQAAGPGRARSGLSRDSGRLSLAAAGCRGGTEQLFVATLIHMLRGSTVTITTLSGRAFNQDTSRAKKAAKKGPVIITNRGRPAHVLLTIEDYQKLAGAQENIADMLAMPGVADIEFEPPRLRGSVARAADLA